MPRAADPRYRKRIPNRVHRRGMMAFLYLIFEGCHVMPKPTASSICYTMTLSTRRLGLAVAAKTVEMSMSTVSMQSTKDIIPSRLPDGKECRYRVDKATVDSVVEDIFMLSTSSVEGIDS